MSQHLTGNMQQTYRTDKGEFVQLLNVRVRKEEILAYRLAGPIEVPEQFKGMYSVNFLMSGGWNSSDPALKEECEKVIAQLDWNYKKDYKGEE